MSEESFIEVYPVGLLRDIKCKRASYGLKRYLWPQIKKRNWRAARNYFNGYLAEWNYPPGGMRHSRCGRGWSRRVAIRRLGIHIAESNVRKESAR